MADQYTGNLKRLKAIAIDMGDKDGLMRGAQALVKVLEANQVPHVFETYDGNHINHVSDRMANQVLAFFEKNLTKK